MNGGNLSYTIQGVWSLESGGHFPLDALLFDGEGVRVELNLCEKRDLINSQADLSVLFLHRHEAGDLWRGIIAQRQKCEDVEETRGPIQLIKNLILLPKLHFCNGYQYKLL